MADRRQGVSSREESSGGIVLAHGPRQRGAFRKSEVRRVRQGKLETRRGAESRKPVGGDQREAGKHPMTDRVRSRERQRLVRRVERGGAAARALEKIRDREHAAAGAGIEQPARLWRLTQSRCQEALRLGAGDERAPV